MVAMHSDCPSISSPHLFKESAGALKEIRLAIEERG